MILRGLAFLGLLAPLHLFQLSLLLVWLGLLVLLLPRHLVVGLLTRAIASRRLLLLANGVPSDAPTLLEYFVIGKVA